MNEDQLFIIDFEPVGRRGRAALGDTLLSAAQDVGVELVSVCGGIGACDSCKVRVASGDMEPATLVEEAVFSVDELAEGWRLACQAEPLGDIKIEIPPESLTTPQRLQIEGELQPQMGHNPAVSAIDLAIDPPSLLDLRSDSQRILEAVQAAGYSRPHISRPVMASASSLLRQQEWSVRLAVRGDGDIVGLLPTNTPLLGLAVDIGTTSVAAYLVDLGSGEVLGKSGAMNPQIAYGEDIISRILYINQHEDGQSILQNRIVEEINQLIASLIQETGSDAAQIVDAVVVGNTAMHHIFAGLPVRQLGEAPYVPSVGGAFTFPAWQVGLDLAPGAKVYMAPNIAGYVGADHVSMQAAVDIWAASQTTIALDIGTNTEVTLAHQGRNYCCSCASGPAFEGAHIGAGMRAAPGAIERVQLVQDQVLTKTIGDKPAVGICGSGILDSVAVMLESGLINERGALKREHPLSAAGEDGKPRFILATAEDSANERAVAVDRGDVAEIQLAKGAIRAGIQILLTEAGIEAGAIEHFIVAGAFGTYIDIESAIRVGMFPDLPLDRFQQVGNAAGMGAVLLLLSEETRRAAAEAARAIHYVELTTYAAFHDEFIRYMTF
jgi:uncharacterized 2Fe-2S/4Fe-4S cluster protein (DUF4445 family)